MGFWDTFDDLLNAANNVRQARNLMHLILQDRGEAMETLKEIVLNSSPQQLDQFEGAFLSASVGLMLPQQRIRAMELYSWLKVLETEHYGKWRGFGTDGEALA